MATNNTLIGLESKMSFLFDDDDVEWLEVHSFLFTIFTSSPRFLHLIRWLWLMLTWWHFFIRQNRIHLPPAWLYCAGVELKGRRLDRCKRFLFKLPSSALIFLFFSIFFLFYFLCLSSLWFCHYYNAVDDKSDRAETCRLFIDFSSDWCDCHRRSCFLFESFIIHIIMAKKEREPSHASRPIKDWALIKSQLLSLSVLFC